MSDTTPPRTTGATDRQIGLVMGELQSWGFARKTREIIAEDIARILVPPGYSIVPDTLLDAARLVANRYDEYHDYAHVPLGWMQDLENALDQLKEERS